MQSSEFQSPVEDRLPAAESSEFDAVEQMAERRASLWTGLVAATVVGILFAGLTAINHGLAAMASGLWVLQMQGVNVQGAASLAIATLTGFVFGITYRYAVRTDINPFLESGVVWAFSLTRGLTQLEIGVMAEGEVFPFLLLAIESVLLFVVARWVLDLGMQQGWVQAFPLDE